MAQVANKLAIGVEQVQDLVVWGNHSPTMFPDLFNAKVNGKRAVDAVDDMAWYENEYLPNVGKRGAGFDVVADAVAHLEDAIQRPIDAVITNMKWPNSKVLNRYALEQKDRAEAWLMLLPIARLLGRDPKELMVQHCGVPQDWTWEKERAGS